MFEKNYAGYTEREVAKSLKVIQDICKSSKDCLRNCPFMDSDKGCHITEEGPGNWDLRDYPKQWTPFK